MVPVALGAVAFLVVSFASVFAVCSVFLALSATGFASFSVAGGACANVTELKATTANAAARAVNMRRIGYPPLDLTLGAGRFRRVALQKTKARTRLASRAIVL